MCKELILCWQNPKTRAWLPVGWLSHDNGLYSFDYTQAAVDAINNKSFLTLSGMNDVNKRYTSDTLFPIFKNRLLAKSRPEYATFLKWLGFEGKEVSDMNELSSSGGIRATDSLQLFPVPKEDNGYYRVRFFAHGIRHFSSCSMGRANELKAGDRLFIMKDIQNKYDTSGLALLLRTEDPPENVGYCPRFLSHDMSYLLDSYIKEDRVKVSITKVNQDSPVHFRLLCEFESPWPQDFTPFNHEAFEKMCAPSFNNPLTLLREA